jgi:hypothetical protein
MKNNDSGSVQLEIIRLNSACTNNMTATFIEMVFKLWEKVCKSPKDKYILKNKMDNISLAERPNASFHEQE